MSDTASTKTSDLLIEEGVVLPDTGHPLPGLGYRKNNDGTCTYYPETYVNFFSHDLAPLQKKLTQEEVALVESVILNKEDLVRQAAYDHLQRWPTLSPLSDERARESALTKLYMDVGKDEFLFVATRSLQEDEIVGAIRLNLNTKHKSVCVAESLPSSVSIRISATIDLCCGKTPLALRQMLAKVHDFFIKWASFREVTDRAVHASRSSIVSCRYELTINMVEDPVKRTSEDWIYPTKSMLEEWGYNPKGVQSYAQSVNESKLVICSV